MEQVGVWPEGVPELPEIPYGLLHVWEAYWDLRAGVAAGFTGPQPISHTEMWAWNANTGAGFTGKHFALIRCMDGAYLEECGKKK